MSKCTSCVCALISQISSLCVLFRRWDAHFFFHLFSIIFARFVSGFFVVWFARMDLEARRKNDYIVVMRFVRIYYCCANSMVAILCEWNMVHACEHFQTEIRFQKLTEFIDRPLGVGCSSCMRPLTHAILHHIRMTKYWMERDSSENSYFSF